MITRLLIRVNLNLNGAPYILAHLRVPTSPSRSPKMPDGQYHRVLPVPLLRWLLCLTGRLGVTLAVAAAPRAGLGPGAGRQTDIPSRTGIAACLRMDRSQRTAALNLAPACGAGWPAQGVKLPSLVTLSGVHVQVCGLRREQL